MSDAEFMVDPRAPLFFLSYAHTHEARRNPVSLEPNTFVRRLFEDLSTHVGELVGRPTGADPGFMDSSMSGGERWTPELLTAAGTCQVFVPLISSSFLNSAWCAMEWHAFARRKIVRRQDGASAHETAIVPVTWSPTNGSPLPPIVGDIQRFSPTNMPDPQIAAQYHREGVYGLLAMRLENAYRAVVWRLAQRVVAIHRAYWVTPQVPVAATELRNVFAQEGVG